MAEYASLFYSARTPNWTLVSHPQSEFIQMKPIFILADHFISGIKELIALNLIFLKKSNPKLHDLSNNCIHLLNKWPIGYDPYLQCQKSKGWFSTHYKGIDLCFEACLFFSWYYRKWWQKVRPRHKGIMSLWTICVLEIF